MCLTMQFKGWWACFSKEEHPRPRRDVLAMDILGTTNGYLWLVQWVPMVSSMGTNGMLTSISSVGTNGYLCSMGTYGI